MIPIPIKNKNGVLREKLKTVEFFGFYTKKECEWYQKLKNKKIYTYSMFFFKKTDLVYRKEKKIYFPSNIFGSLPDLLIVLWT